MSRLVTGLLLKPRDRSGRPLAAEEKRENTDVAERQGMKDTQDL